MKKHRQQALFLSLMFMLPSFLAAHHSVAEFDTQRDVTVRATVTEVWFNNPHVRYYATEIDADGNEIHWDIHTSSPNSLIRSGWYEDAVKVGDEVAFTGAPTRAGEPHMLVHTIELADGRIVSNRRR